MQPLTPEKLPPQNCRRIIEETLVVFNHPVQKLKLLNTSIEVYFKIPLIYRIYPRLAEVAIRKKILDVAETIRPGSRSKIKKLMRDGSISRPAPMLWRVYRFRHAIVTVVLGSFVWGMSSAVAALWDFMENDPRSGLPIARHIGKPVSDSDPALKGRLDHTGVQRNANLVRIKIPVPNPTTSPASVTEVQPEPPSSEQTESTLYKGFTVYSESIKTPDTQVQADPQKKDRAVGRDANTVEAKHSLQKKSSVKKPTKALLAAAADHLTDPHDDVQVDFPDYLKEPIWLVDQQKTIETYSNRLHIYTTYTTANLPRQYYRFERGAADPIKNAELSQKVAGIMYHASESDILPFQPEMNSSLKKYTASLIRYIQRNKSYHYFIDRFGRVFRIVKEDHAAFHAGHSIWSDKKNIYLNLNHAFIGICFEGRDFVEEVDHSQDGSQKKRIRSKMKMAPSSINEVQVQSGKELTDWLRVKYDISQHNCIPHGLASVNPTAKLIGYHLDLSHGFPFHRFKLTNKYNEPLPSIVEFGFGHDQHLVEIFNGELWPGVRLSQALLRAEARHHQMAFSRFRKKCQKKFSQMYVMEKELKESYTKDAKKSPQREKPQNQASRAIQKKSTIGVKDEDIYLKKEKIALSLK
jgi:hypothetical protein